MPSPESPTFNAVPATNGELAGETPRQTYEVRGETTLKAEHEQRERELLEERARIMDRLQVLNAEIAKSKQKLGIQNISEQGQNPVTLEGSEESENSPAEIGTPVAPVAPENPTGSETASTQPIPTEPESEPVQDTTGNASSATGETGANDPETQPSPEDIQNTINKTKKNKGFKKVIVAAATVAMAGIIAAGAWLGINAFNKNNKSNNNPDRPGVTDVADVGSAVGESHETEGIYDGYGEKGMWLSENKGGSYDFASAKEVAEVCDNDECEMIKYTARNQVESYADYLANLPEELQPEGFKGLTILETEKKLESLSDEEFEAVKQVFDSTIDGAYTRRVTINGEQNNAYMRLKDSNKGANHGNMELVACTTNENNLEVTQLYWVDKDGKEIGTMNVKMTPVYDGNGNITGFRGCNQVVGVKTSVYNGLTKITENPPTTPPTDSSETPTPTPGPTPTPNTPEEPPTPKNQQEADINSGAKQGIVTPEEQKREITEEPVADQDHEYNQDSNTYYYMPAEIASQIGYDVVDNGTYTVTVKTTKDTDEANNFDAGASIGTGETTSDDKSADGSGNTIQENLDSATGNQEANPSGDYSQGF